MRSLILHSEISGRSAIAAGDRLFRLLRRYLTELESRFYPAALERVLFFGWTFAFSLFLLLAVDSLINPLGKDLSVFVYVAQGLLEGDMPYVDRWDQKGPLTFVLTLIGTILGGSYGIWTLGTAFLLGSTWFVFKVTKEAFGATAALVAGTLFLFSFRRVADGGGLTEHYALLFQCLTLFLFLRVSQGRTGGDRIALVAIGALGAAAFLLRPNLIGVWLTIGLYWTLQIWAFQRREALRWIVWSAAGGLAVLGLTAIVIASLGAFGAMWDAVIVYNFTYSDALFINRLGVLRDLRGALILISLPLMAGWGIGLYYYFTGRAKGTRFEDVLPLTLFLLPIETLLLTTSGYGFNHYFVALLPAAGLTLAFLTKFLLSRSTVAPLLLATLLLVPIVYYNLPDYRVPIRTVERIVDKYSNAADITTDRYTTVAQRVRQLTEPEDQILVWGNQPQVYLQSQRDALTRFFTQFPLINRRYADEGVRREFISGFIGERPMIVVETGDGRLPPLDSTERADWIPKGRRYMDPGLYPQFFEFFDTNYQPIEVVDGFTIYELKDST